MRESFLWKNRCPGLLLLIAKATEQTCGERVLPLKESMSWLLFFRCKKRCPEWYSYNRCPHCCCMIRNQGDRESLLWKNRCPDELLPLKESMSWLLFFQLKEAIILRGAFLWQNRCPHCWSVIAKEKTYVVRESFLWKNRCRHWLLLT